MPAAITDWIDAASLPFLARLGRDPNWLRYEGYTDAAGRPCTRMHPNREILERTGAVRLVSDIANRGNWAALSIVEALAAAVTDGPKLFAPTEEQWEAMEHVEMHLPISDYAQPYPAMVVEMPPGARARLAKQFGQPAAELPRGILVRHRNLPDEAPLLVTHMGRAHTNREVFYLFQHNAGNPTIEAALGRDAGAAPDAVAPVPMFELGRVATRAALNLCLMLAHYGHTTRAPEYRNRAARRAGLHADFSTVLMKQTIQVRAAGSAGAEPGTLRGPGPELPPHWRRGHWRAHPGYGARRAAGERVPLILIKPVLVRADRAVGDLAASAATYTG